MEEIFEPPTEGVQGPFPPFRNVDATAWPGQTCAGFDLFRAFVEPLEAIAQHCMRGRGEGTHPSKVRIFIPSTVWYVLCKGGLQRWPTLPWPNPIFLRKTPVRRTVRPGFFRKTPVRRHFNY